MFTLHTAPITGITRITELTGDTPISSSQFEGFPKDFFSFFNELKNNNNREWFQLNKSRYEQSVVLPMGLLITAIAPELQEISPFYRADPKPHGGSMFRIYRDTRFSADKSPYKTHAACHFRHQAGRDAHAPGFYIHLATDEVSIGGGIWRPPSKSLARIRDFILDNPGAWQKLKRSRDVTDMGGIQCNALKRPPRGYDANARHIEDLKRKSFFLMQRFDPGLALSPGLVKEAATVFAKTAGLNHFINDALELPFRRANSR
jgi:uncharacterized protein (TIGR02453 family)